MSENDVYCSGWKIRLNHHYTWALWDLHHGIGSEVLSQDLYSGNLLRELESLSHLLVNNTHTHTHTQILVHYNKTIF